MCNSTEPKHKCSEDGLIMLHLNVRGYLSHIAEVNALVRGMSKKLFLVTLNESFLNKAIEHASEKFAIQVKEFTVLGVPHDSLFGHHWYVGTDDVVDPKILTKVIDQQLKVLNDDYAIERKHALKKVNLTLVPTALFYDWMRLQGKEGGQNKFPRVLKGDRAASWKQFMSEKGLE